LPLNATPQQRQDVAARRVRDHLNHSCGEASAAVAMMAAAVRAGRGRAHRDQRVTPVL